jgi:hypothetical protein
MVETLRGLEVSNSAFRVVFGVRSYSARFVGRCGAHTHVVYLVPIRHKHVNALKFYPTQLRE